MWSEPGQTDLFGTTDAGSIFETTNEERLGLDDPEGAKINEAQRSIDDLVSQALRYRRSRDYLELLRFAGSFRAYSPFNALLIHIQLPGSTYVAPARRWQEYGRRIVPGQRPLAILQPFGPVMFVFDVTQTEQIPGEAAIPAGVTPFAMAPLGGAAPALDWLTTNAKADGVRVSPASAGSHRAGCIWARSGSSQAVEVSRRPLRSQDVPVRYECEVNRSFDASARYATLAHELAHLYCGHVGTHNPKWWPNRSNTLRDVAEFEAESAAYIACLRLDDEAAMPPYLDSYLGANGEVPEAISLNRIMASAERVIEMSKGWLAPRR